MREIDSSHYLEKFNEILEVVEKKCVAGDANFVEILNSHIHYNAKYLQNLFSFVADISLKDYVRRRRLTEAFYKIENFANQKMSQTVNGITNAKRKIIREFGESLLELQPYIYEEICEEKLKRRLEWKLNNRLWKRKEITDDRLVLFSTNPNHAKYNLDRTYFVCNGRYIGIKGQKSGQILKKDVLMSSLLRQNVYITTYSYESANKAVEDIYNVMKGVNVSSEKSKNLMLTVHWDEGFELRNLVTAVTIQDDIIIDIKVDERLMINGDELVLDIF